MFLRDGISRITARKYWSGRGLPLFPGSIGTLFEWTFERPVLILHYVSMAKITIFGFSSNLNGLPQRSSMYEIMIL